MDSQKKKQDETSVAPPEAVKFLDAMLEQHFQGKDGEILQTMLNVFSFENTADLFLKVEEAIKKQTGKEDFNISDIESLDILAIGRELINGIDIENISIEMTEEEATNFGNTFKEFSRSSLHDVAFPIMVVENPQVAGSVKNLIQRTVDSIQQQENVDLSDVYEELDIENLPTEFSMEMLMELGGSIPGMELLLPPTEQVEVQEYVENKNEAITEIQEAEVIYEKKNNVSEQIIVFCELSDEQVWFLAYRLWEMGAINNYKRFHALLKSKGKYESIMVKDKGLVLSVIHILFKKQTISGIRYLYTSGVGFWPIFQQYLLDAKTQKGFEQDLHKVREANCKKEEATDLLEEVLSPANQAKNLEKITKSIFKK